MRTLSIATSTIISLLSRSPGSCLPGTAPQGASHCPTLSFVDLTGNTPGEIIPQGPDRQQEGRWSSCTTSPSSFAGSPVLADVGSCPGRRQNRARCRRNQSPEGTVQ